MRTTRLSVLAVIVLLALSAFASASVPPMINYQGKLMNPDGTPVTDGTYMVTFTIYDAQTGGNVRWSEPGVSVQVKGGLFAVLLGGNGTNLPANIFDGPDRWFGIKVNDDPEMVPRQKIASVPYAQTAGNGTPVGGIIMWSGSLVSIPAGWALCDGTNGTPNLQDRFVVGAGAQYAVGDKGGFKELTLTVSQMPSHTHIQDAHTHTQNPHYHGIVGVVSWPVEGTGPWGWNAPWSTNISPRIGAVNNTSSFTATNQNATATNQNTGGNQPHENRPPYYALCFIMKLGY